ncbi:MAG: terminase [Terriglobia bacterium]|nr:terminase [Terriglobia bacterium]
MSLVELVLLEELGKNLNVIPGPDKNIREILMRALLRIRDKQGGLQPLVLNRAQHDYQRHCGKKNIVLKARQLGITTYVAARFFLRTITQPGTLTVQVAHDQRAAEQIFRIVYRFLENLPESLRKSLYTSRANVRQVVFPEIDCEYRVETASDRHAGRGLTIQNLHCSEVAMWPDGAAALAALRAAVPPGGEIVLESTPNGAAGAFYREWQNAGETGYIRHFFPWWLDESYRVTGRPVGALSEEERMLIEQHGLDEDQIAFRRDVKANFGARAREEFAEDAQTCFRSSGECVFELDTLEERLKNLVEPIERRDNGRLRIWLPFVAGRRFIIGVDPAGGGIDGDFACAQVVDRDTGLQCAELLGHLRPEELAREIARLGREYGDALVAVERNNHGHAVLACLQLQERYANLFHEGGGPRREAGWLTTAANRPPMLENLAAVLRANPSSLQSPRLLEQCRTFVRGKDGRAEAAAGSHDDAVMAMAIALAVRAQLA